MDSGERFNALMFAIGGAVIVALFLIISSCSIQQAQLVATSQTECVRAHGQWKDATPPDRAPMNGKDYVCAFTQ